MNLICFYDVLNNLTVKAEFAPYNIQERYLALKYISDFSINDLLLFDRGFLSYTIFQSVMTAGSKFCMRLQRGSQLPNRTGKSVETCKQDFYAKVFTLNITALFILEEKERKKKISYAI